MKINRISHKDFEIIFNENYTTLCKYSYVMVADGDVAEDIVQDVFVYLWNNRKDIVIKSSLKSYLYSSVRHASLNYIKRRAIEEKHNPLVVRFIEEYQQFENTEQELRDLHKARKIIKLLPDQCRKVFLMSSTEGLKYKEIAEELDISVNTVKTHISKAYRHIKKHLSTEIDLILFYLSCKKTESLLRKIKR